MTTNLSLTMDNQQIQFSTYNSYNSDQEMSTTTGFFSASSSSFVAPSSTPSRMKNWKNRDYLKGSPANQLKNRRDEFVARFRGIDYNSETIKGENEDDAKWSWDTLVNTEWDSNKSEPKEVIPWYVFDESLTWDEFLELNEKDRKAKGIDSAFHRNDMMLDLEEFESGDDKRAPWAVATEIIIEALINIEDPNTILCPTCHGYSMIKKFEYLVCTKCHNYHGVHPGITIPWLKQRMLQSCEAHKSNCTHNFAYYGMYKGNITLICNYCHCKYNISGNC